MKEYEANECVKNIIYLDRNNKELSRYQLYVSINSHSKNTIKPEQIMELPWDNKFLNETEHIYDIKEKEELDKKADSFADMLNNGTLKMESANLI